jgi:biotin transport system substrate-specific component
MEQKEKQFKKPDIRAMAECGLFAAILCVFSPMTIPIGPIPISLGIFAVMVTGVVLPWKKASLSVMVYLLIGICGLPLFSGGKSGLPALVGPTGGYVWSYFPMVILIALLNRRTYKSRVVSILVAAAACIAGTAVCYAFGTVQFMFVAGYTLHDALAVCVYPFIPFDLVKAACASILGVNVRLILKKAGSLQ